MIKLVSYLFPKKESGGGGGGVYKSWVSQLDVEVGELVEVLTTLLITVIKHLTGSTLRKGEFNPAHRLTALPAWLGSLGGKRHKAAGHAPSRGSESRDWIDDLA